MRGLTTVPKLLLGGLLALATVLVVEPELLIAEAEAAPFTLKTADGLTLKAESFGKGTNGIVLVHDKSRSAADWSSLSSKLATSGFHVVVLDMRGHGASKPPDTVGAEDWPKMVQDVAAATAWLQSKGATKIAILGAGFGANVALAHAAENPKVTNLVLLSPGLNLQGITTATAMETYGQRPVLLVASSEDAYGMKTATLLETKATGQKHLEVLEGAGSGHKMLNRAASLEGTIMSWLNESFYMKPGVQAPPPTFSTGDTTSLETTGEKLGEVKK